MLKSTPSITKALLDLKRRPSHYWEEKGRQAMLNNFNLMAKSVSAYRKFLKEYKIKTRSIKTWTDYQSLPITSRRNYLQRYDYPDLFPDDNFFQAKTISATSGTSGEAFYFPRGEKHDAVYEYMAEIFLINQFSIDKKKTLVLMGFALGIWIGGIFTYKILNSIAARGYVLTIIPTGTNRVQFLKALKHFGRLYDQIILMGYPPFIKDIVDEAMEHGIDWSDYHIRIIMAAEGFSERFRGYLKTKLYLSDILLDIVNIYGTVELGTMAVETPISYLIRQLVAADKKLFRDLFPGAATMPTVAQYYPHLINFEAIKGKIVVSGSSAAIPLTRYELPDLGGIISFAEMIDKFKNHNIDLLKTVRVAGIEQTVFYLPFVYVYARADQAIVFRGANIYPEEIKNALDESMIDQYLTGRFTMIKKENDKLDQILEINVGLRKNLRKSLKLKKQTLKLILKELCDHNSEFNNEYLSNPDKAAPTVKLWTYQYPRFFSRIGKQKWVEN